MDSRFRGNDVSGRLRSNDGVTPSIPFPSYLTHTKAGRAGFFTESPSDSSFRYFSFANFACPILLRFSK